MLDKRNQKLLIDLAGNIYIVEKEFNIFMVFYDDKCYNIMSGKSLDGITGTFEELDEI